MSASDVLLDPVGTVTAAVAVVDPGADTAAVRRIVEQVGGGRAKRRRLAMAVSADPSVLRTGRSPAPRVVGRSAVGVAGSRGSRDRIAALRPLSP